MPHDVNIDWKMSSEPVSDSIFKFSLFRRNTTPGSALDRYGFIRDDWPETSVNLTESNDAITLESDKATFQAGKTDTPTLTLKDADGKTLLTGKAIIRDQGGIEMEFGLADGETFYGLGDQTRDRLQQRGHKAQMWVVNVSSYIPIPFIMSSNGYGLFFNTTYRHYHDLGATDPKTWRMMVTGGNLDVYVIRGNDYKDILAKYTDITGKPALPPKWSFGLWFICRMQANDFEVISDALNFRDRKIPCDLIGLEPGWMQTNYDASTNKDWHKERFPLPSYNKTHNFISALKRMGFKLELWLCNDYDLTYEAERQAGKNTKAKTPADTSDPWKDAAELDEHFFNPRNLDKITNIDKPWFDHLKKFVDWGADMFKQDGAWQVCPHPDRAWGNGMTDDEAHNLYPLLYSQQMFDGFKNHTDRRPVGFTAAGWTGIQKYTGSWTGDTGGGFKTMVACLNLGLSGHSLVTCDMEVTQNDAIHYGFLMPWAQVNSWNYFRHPWLQGDKLYPVFKAYANLRSQLVPYLYSYAHEAHTTGLPIMRAMVLEYPGDVECTDLMTQYMLGNELLVSAFTDTVYLPEGKWLDFWTHDVHEGPKTFAYTPPENRGGGLFVKEDSIIPLGPLVQYTGQDTDEGFDILVFLNGQGEAKFDLYDDDGLTYTFEQGDYAIHTITAEFDGETLKVEWPDELTVDSVTAHLDTLPKNLVVNGQGKTFAWDDTVKTLRCQVAE